MDFDGPSAEVEELLKCFLMGTHNVALAGQILDIGNLPVACRERVRAAQALGRAWSAWSTPRGPMVVWADYDAEGSKRLKAHLLFVEWYAPPCEYHSAWCHCYPNRRTEWIFGRGILEEKR